MQPATAVTTFRNRCTGCVTIRMRSTAGNTGIASIHLGLSSDSIEITDSFDYPNLNENIPLSRGFNKIVVEWKEDSNGIEVKKLL